MIKRLARWVLRDELKDFNPHGFQRMAEAIHDKAEERYLAEDETTDSIFLGVYVTPYETVEIGAHFRGKVREVQHETG